jgi:hypothetical protein
MMRTQADLVLILANGGDFDLNNRRRSQLDLVQLAANAKARSVRLVLRGLGTKTTTDLVQIVANGGGNVMFVLQQALTKAAPKANPAPPSRASRSRR